MSHYHAYPTDLGNAALCAREGVTILRSGDLSAKRKELGACLYTVQGTAMHYVLGAPEELQPIGDCPLDEDCKAAFAELRDECTSYASAPHAYGNDGLDFLITLAIQQLIKWIEAFLNRE